MANAKHQFGFVGFHHPTKAELRRGVSFFADLDYLEAKTTHYFRIPRDALRSSQRARYIVRPRQIFAALASRLTEHSYEEIARYLNQNQSTVRHAERAVDRLMESRRFCADLCALMGLIDLEKPAGMFLNMKDGLSAQERPPDHLPLQLPAQRGPLDDPSGNHLNHARTATHHSHGPTDAR
jgi:hypothetical protein